MDPNLFHVDWERTFEAVGLIVILAFIVERALAVLFESRMFVCRYGSGPAKEVIATVVSIIICFAWKFDALSMIVLTEHTTPWGFVLTGMVIAGGSKGAVKLFHDLLNIKSSAVAEQQEVNRVTKDVRVEEAVANAIATAKSPRRRKRPNPPDAIGDAETG